MNLQGFRDNWIFAATFDMKAAKAVLGIAMKYESSLLYSTNF
jgi:hypothetical protein